MTALEARMADLEGGARGFAFASGRAAIATVLELLNSGAHVILQEGMHGGRYGLFEDIRRRSAGLRLSYVDTADRAALEAAFVPDETRMVWVESPGSFKASLADPAAVADFARAHELISVCDNSNATPYLQRPVEHGYTISLHSAPGFLFGGLVDEAGIAVTAEGQDFLTDKLGFLRSTLGMGLAPAVSDCAARAIGSLAPRMARTCDTAERVGDFLEAHPAVTDLRYPGLGEPGRERAGALLSFVVQRDIAATREALARLGVIRAGEEPSGLASVIEHVADRHFAMVPAEIRSGLGIADGLCRLWVGLEDADDLIADMVSALG